MPETRMRMHIRAAVFLVKTDIDKHPLDFNFSKIDKLINGDYSISHSLLKKKFRELYGCSLKAYEKKKRIEAAMVMLEEGRLTLPQIAKKCKYGSQSSFTRAFKEVLGLTPTEWENSQAKLEL